MCDYVNASNMLTETSKFVRPSFWEIYNTWENKVRAIQSHTLPQNLRCRKNLEIIQISLLLLYSEEVKWYLKLQ